MNNSQPRTIMLDTSFLGEGDYTMTYWADGKRPTDVVKKTVKLSASRPIKIRLAEAGVYVAIIKAKD